MKICRLYLVCWGTCNLYLWNEYDERVSAESSWREDEKYFGVTDKESGSRCACRSAGNGSSAGAAPQRSWQSVCQCRTYEPAQAISIIFGANIGTTMTAQIIAFKDQRLHIYHYFVGFIIAFIAKSEKAKV